MKTFALIASCIALVSIQTTFPMKRSANYTWKEIPNKLQKFYITMHNPNEYAYVYTPFMDQHDSNYHVEKKQCIDKNFNTPNAHAPSIKTEQHILNLDLSPEESITEEELTEEIDTISIQFPINQEYLSLYLLAGMASAINAAYIQQSSTIARYGRSIEVPQISLQLQQAIKQEISETKTKLHPCPNCDKSSSSAKALKRNQSVHTKPYKCIYCGSSFSRRSLLINHINKRHPCETQTTDRREKPFQCNTCYRSFTQKNNLTIHMRTQHTNEKL